MLSWRVLLPCSLLLAVFFAFPAFSEEQAAATGNRPLTVVSLDLEGAVSPVVADLLDAALKRAGQEGALMLLVRLDTPGGGVEVMRRMVKAIRQSPVPVVLYVSPAGARAASAGVFLMAAAQVNAMAPQTTIGSASPVAVGGEDIGKTMDAKVKNDLSSLVRSLAEATGRNAAWYQRAVTRAENITAAQAVRERVVDYLATDRADLLEQIGKRGLPSPDGPVRFAAAGLRIVEHEPSWQHVFLAWLLDPQIAYILLLIGVAGVFFELSTPGVILPGVVGGLCLLLALYALSVLPTNAAGLLLLLFGGGLFLLEIHVTSYGLLSLSGLAALFFGSLLLIREDGASVLPLRLIAPTVLGVCALLSAAVWLLAKAQRQKARVGVQALVGDVARVRQWTGTGGKVFVHGEIWNAALDKDEAAAPPLNPGDAVVVVAVKDMLLVVSARKEPRNPA